MQKRTSFGATSIIVVISILVSTAIFNSHSSHFTYAQNLTTLSNDNISLTSQETTIIGGHNISMLLSAINSNITQAQKSIQANDTVSANNYLSLALQDIVVLKQKLEHIGNSIMKCIDTDCGRPPFPVPEP